MAQQKLYGLTEADVAKIAKAIDQIADIYGRVVNLRVTGARAFHNSPAGIAIDVGQEPTPVRWWPGIVTEPSVGGGVKSKVKRAYTDGETFAAFAGTVELEVEAVHMEAAAYALGGVAAAAPNIGDVVIVFQVSGNATEPVFLFSSRSGQDLVSVKIVSSESIGSGIWLYQVQRGRFSLNGTEVGFTLSTEVATVSCINTAEFGTGDGVPNPPPVGTLTKLPHPAGSYRLAKWESPGLMAFCMGNPYESACE